MSKIGDQIRSNTELERTKISVEEWGQDGEPLVLFATPLLAGEFSRLQKKHKDFINNPSVDGLVDLIIMKAQDAEGEKVFDIEDRPILLRQPIGVVTSVATALMGNLFDLDETAKN